VLYIRDLDSFDTCICYYIDFISLLILFDLMTKNPFFDILFFLLYNEVFTCIYVGVKV